VLELYHSINSVCAQKIRLALVEKGLSCTEHLMKLNGDQFDPAYLKLNPNGVVPTLLHDGTAITESSVILYYLDEVFPSPTLMPTDPVARAKVRQFNKLIDEYVHNSCMILTFATAFRPPLLRIPEAQRNAEFARSPIKKRVEYKADAVAHGLQSIYVAEAVCTIASSWLGSMRLCSEGRISRAMAIRSPRRLSFRTSCDLSCCACRGCGTTIRE